VVVDAIEEVAIALVVVVAGNDDDKNDNKYDKNGDDVFV
jgi:hypothetical protein